MVCFNCLFCVKKTFSASIVEQRKWKRKRYPFTASSFRFRFHKNLPLPPLPASASTSLVSTVKDWSTNRWRSIWNKRKNCLRMKESVGWTSSRLTIRLLNFKRPQLNRVVQALTGHCNLQRHKKTTGRAESSLCPKCSLEDANHHVGNCKLYQDIHAKYFGITKTTVHNVVTKSNIKGGESSSQFRWFTIAKIELQFLIFFVLILELRLQKYSANTRRCPPKKVFGNSEFCSSRQNHSSLNY